jgi:hypothetical protein
VGAKVPLQHQNVESPSKYIERRSNGNSKIIYVWARVVKCRVNEIDFIEESTYYNGAEKHNN